MFVIPIAVRGTSWCTNLGVYTFREAREPRRANPTLDRRDRSHEIVRCCVRLNLARLPARATSGRRVELTELSKSAAVSFGGERRRRLPPLCVTHCHRFHGYFSDVWPASLFSHQALVNSLIFLRRRSTVGFEKSVINLIAGRRRREEDVDRKLLQRDDSSYGARACCAVLLDKRAACRKFNRPADSVSASRSVQANSRRLITRSTCAAD